jgi:hypothetical protein
MLVTPREMKALASIEQLIRKPIAWAGDAPAASTVAEPAPERRRSRRAKAKPPGSAKQAERAAPVAMGDEPKAARKSSSGRSPSPRNGNGSAGRRGEPAQRREHQREPEANGFHAGNLPAFLARPVRV